jgi:hypothetical protein
MDELAESVPMKEINNTMAKMKPLLTKVTNNLKKTQEIENEREKLGESKQPIGLFE